MLTVLLERGGAKGLEYHLAHCLSVRNNRGDLKEALKHAERSTGPDAPEDSWLQLAQLSNRQNGASAGLVAVRRGLRFRPDSAPLYTSGADMLLSAGKVPDAIALLKEGIQAVPPERNRASLYQRCAELLAKEARIDEAIELLRDALVVIPPEKGLFSIYQVLGTLYCRSGQPKAAVASHIDGISRISDHKNSYKLAEAALFLTIALDDSSMIESLLTGTGGPALGIPQIALGKVLQLQNQGLWHKAAEEARAARRSNENHFRLAIHESFSLLACHDPSGAWQALSSFPKLTFGVGEPHGWLASLIHLHCSAHSEAKDALSVYLGRAVDERAELHEDFLIRLWDEEIAPPQDRQICFYFPIMPPALTGLGVPLRRTPFSRPVIPPNTVLQSRMPPRPDRRKPTAPDIFVCYAWGEDETPQGKRREELVDLLCDKIRNHGHEIGRDKEHMRSGDSVDEFANSISRGRRIVAVISEKSLRSKFCMAQELFRAYRRCNYDKEEFQKKVIALVMDDALKYLQEDKAILDLAKDWQGIAQEMRTNLQAVDPQQKSRSVWVFTDLLDEMVTHFPGMMDALNDAKMTRGFDAIVANEFREVLDLLPTGSYSDRASA